MPATAATTRRLVSLPEAAGVLGVSVKTVRRYIAAGDLEAVRLGRRLIRIKAESLDRLIDAHPINLARTIEFATAGWLEWYNQRRLHGSLWMIGPVEFENAQYAALNESRNPYRSGREPGALQYVRGSVPATTRDSAFDLVVVARRAHRRHTGSTLAGPGRRRGRGTRGREGAHLVSMGPPQDLGDGCAQPSPAPRSTWA